MADRALQDLRRRAAATGSPEDAAALLVARLRSAPGCERCGGTGKTDAEERIAQIAERGFYEGACPACAGTGSPLRARVELAAYCGDEAAASAAGWTSYHVLDRGPHSMVKASDFFVSQGGLTQEWGRNWRRVFAAGPEESGLEAARAQAALSSWLSGLSRWADVGPAPGWVLVVAAMAAARVAWPKHLEREHGLGLDEQGRLYELDPGDWISRASLNDGMQAVVLAPLSAIGATAAWVACPCREHADAWAVAFTRPPLDRLAWVPMCEPNRTCSATREGEIRAAAQLAGEAPVRTAICQALSSWALGEGS